jgi:hypothetical protein
LKTTKGQGLITVWGLVILIFAMPTDGFATSSVEEFSSKSEKSSGRAKTAYNYGQSPLHLSSQSPGQSLRLNMPPIVPEEIKPGGFKLSFGSAWTNVWARNDRFFLDYEMLDSYIALSYGISDRLGLALGFNQRNYFGGAMDNSIQEFHDLFGMSLEGRDTVPHNDTRLIWYDKYGNVIEDTTDVSRANNNNVLFAAQFILYHGTNLIPAVGIAGIVRYGVDTPPSEHGDEPADIGIGIGLSKRWADRWYSYHYLGHTHYGQTELFDLKFQKNSFSGMTAVAWHWRPNSSIILQYMYYEGALQDFGSLSNSSHEVDFGLKWQFTDGGIFEIGMIENIITYDNSPDFGIHLAYEHRW